MLKRYIVKRYIKPMSEHYFFVEDLSGEENTLSIVKNGSGAPTVTVEYSTDEQTWQTLGTTSTTALTYNFPANSRVYLRANTNSWGYNYTGTQINCSKNYEVGGNLFSLLYGTNFTGLETDTPTSSYDTFNSLFYNSTTLINAKQLVINLPTVRVRTLNYMFGDCINLITTPNLNNIQNILDQGCQAMFYNCTSLVTAPDLSHLHQDNLEYQSLRMIFSGCTSLNEIKVGWTDWKYASFCQGWVSNVGSTGTFYKPTALTPSVGNDYIPANWTVINQ